jgi:hypothetical protein
MVRRMSGGSGRALNTSSGLVPLLKRAGAPPGPASQQRRLCRLILITGVLLFASAHLACAQSRGSPATKHRAQGVLWQGDMEEGTLADWYAPEKRNSGDNGGGAFDSDGGRAVASTAEARTGRWGAKLELPEGQGGARLFRWRELYLHRRVTVAAWIYIPTVYTLTADPSTSYLNIFQFKSDSATRNDPFWFLNVSNPGPGRMRADLVWWPRDVEGPHRGEMGYREFPHNGPDLPVGRWFRLKATIRQSSDFGGQLRIWQDERLLYSLDGVRTGYRNCSENSWCVQQGWSVNLYSDGLAPAPAVLYVDDASVRLPSTRASARR